MVFFFPQTDFICKGSGGFGREPLVVLPFGLGGYRIDFVARRGTWWPLPSKTPREMVKFLIFLHLSLEVLTFLLPRPPGDSRVPWVPSGCLLGAFWVPPGCLLGASWVPPGWWKSMKINEIQWKSIKFNENRWNSMKFNENQWKYMKIYGNQSNSIKIYEN